MHLNERDLSCLRGFVTMVVLEPSGSFYRNSEETNFTIFLKFDDFLIRRVPKMLRVNPARVFKKLANTRRLSTLTQASDKDDEWVEVAEYPKIKDCSFDKHRHWKNLSWYEKIKKIETIEEKLIEINMPRYYGFKCLLLGSQFPYNTLPFIQYATNTELEIGEFHSSADPEEAKRVDNFLGLIKSEIADALEFELDGHL